jgi:serine/threonine-protein kinase
MAASRLPKPIQFGRYEAIGRLASGGMATVYLARAVSGLGHGQAVALKVLHPHLAEDRENLRRLIDEARIVARIHHPNVVRLLDAVSEKDEIFLVLEYVHGCSLAELLGVARERHDLPTPAVAAAIVHQALLGLHGAHEARGETGELLDVVHRDISPHNILVSAAGSAHVLDFGIARAQERLHETKTNGVVGKLTYMAPEQLAGGDVTRRTDLYGMGIVLWEALTGEALFATHADRTRALAPGWSPKRPSEQNPDVPAALDAFVLRLLAAEPAGRFATAEAAATALAVASPLAPPTEVAEWVRGVGSDRLDAQDALLQSALRNDVRMARTEGAAERPDASVREEPARARWPRRAAIVALVALAGVSAASLGLVSLRRRHATRASDPPAPAASVAELQPDAAPAASAAATATVASTSPPAVDPPPPRPTPTRRGRERGRADAGARVPQSASSAVPSATGVRCDPPYSIDAQGIKVYRPECVAR